MSVSQLRHRLTDLLESKRLARKTELKRRLSRAIQLLDIAAAQTSAERHALIMQLPVRISLTPADDGRAGTYRTFIAGGKPRFRVFVAAPRPVVESERPDGGGTPVVSSKPDPCYYEGEEVDCATQAELDDAAILAADLEAESDGYDAENDATNADLDDWCLNYGPCDGYYSSAHVATAAALENPSDDADCGEAFAIPCKGAMAVAVLATVAAVGARWSLWGLATAALGTVSAPALAVAVGLALVAYGLAAVAVGDASNCVQGLPRVYLEPLPEFDQHYATIGWH